MVRVPSPRLASEISPHTPDLHRAGAPPTPTLVSGMTPSAAHHEHPHLPRGKPRHQCSRPGLPSPTAARRPTLCALPATGPEDSACQPRSWRRARLGRGKLRPGQLRERPSGREEGLSCPNQRAPLGPQGTEEQVGSNPHPPPRRPRSSEPEGGREAVGGRGRPSRVRFTSPRGLAGVTTPGPAPAVGGPAQRRAQGQRERPGVQANA